MRSWVISTIIAMILAFVMHLSFVFYDSFTNRFNIRQVLDKKLAEPFKGYIIKDEFFNIEGDELSQNAQHLEEFDIKFRNEYVVYWLCRFKLNFDENIKIQSSRLNAGYILSIYDYNFYLIDSIDSDIYEESKIDIEIIYNSDHVKEIVNVKSQEDDRKGSDYHRLNISTNEGLVLLKAFIPDKSFREIVINQLQGLSCQKVKKDNSLN